MQPVTKLVSHYLPYFKKSFIKSWATELWETWKEPAGYNLQKRAKYSPGASPSPVQLSQASQGGTFSPDNEEDF